MIACCLTCVVFVRRERPRLLQQAIGNAELADVVQKRRPVDRLEHPAVIDAAAAASDAA